MPPMTFPVEFSVFGYSVHPHPVFEVLAYALGFQLWRFNRRLFPAADSNRDARIWIIVGALAGAALGSKLLDWFEWAEKFWKERNTLEAWIGGKTIVGGLLGGWVGVEIAKHTLGVKTSTGDAVVFPLIVGMAIGRIGCFLTGLEDHTHGVETTLPWGVDFGDGILRHPTQLYDIAWLLLSGIVLLFVLRLGPLANGTFFRVFLADYLLYRFFIEFIKPSPKPLLGLSAIQCACLIGVVVALWSLRKIWHTHARGIGVAYDQTRNPA